MKDNYENIERYYPDLEVGLTSEQVKIRNKQNLVNSDRPIHYKSTASILFGNIFSLYNVIYYILTTVIVITQNWWYLLMVIFVIANIVIGIVHDFNVRKNNKSTEGDKVAVLRDGKEIEIASNEIVLDDIVVAKNNSKLYVDGLIRFGSVNVNESSINGRSNSSSKGIESAVYAGSFVTSGYAKIQVSAVGNHKSIKDIRIKTKNIKKYHASITRVLEVMFLLVSLITLMLVLINDIVNYKNTEITTILSENVKTFVLILPIGLFTIVSLSHLLSAVSLKKKSIGIQDLSAVEALTKADIICFDKTGTITDANLRVKTIDPIGDYSLDQINQALVNLLEATHDSNITTEAIRNYTTYEPTLSATAAIPFTSETKYSGASFGTKGTYIMGPIDRLKMANKAAITYRSEEYTKNGYSVLCLGKSMQQIKGTTFNEQLEPVALIVLEDSVRENMIDILKYIKDMNIDVKIISGDSARTTCEVSKSAGVQNAEQYISLVNATDDEVKRFANEYTIFGGATPEQKAIIVSALKKNKNNVVMIGDGINDALALKTADCSIAMGTGNEVAKSASQIILEDSNIANLKTIFKEGEKSSRNLWGVSSMFLSKAFFMILFFALIAFLPFINKDLKLVLIPEQFVVWEILTLLASFALIFQKMPKKYTQKPFVSSTVVTSLVSGLITFLFIIGYLVAYYLRTTGFVYLDLSLAEYSGSLVKEGFTIGHLQLNAIITATITLFGLATLFRVCNPFNANRKIIFSIASIVVVSLLGVEIALSIIDKGEFIFMKTAFNLVTVYQWAFSAMLLVVVFALYIFIVFIIEYVRGRKNENIN